MKKLISVVLCVVIIALPLLSNNVSAADSGVSCEIESGVLYVYGEGEMNTAFSNDNSINEVYIERGVTSIPVGAFSGCANLERVTMSDSVSSIGIGAFENCTNLKQVRLSKNIELIPEFLFSNCTSLTGIKLPDSVTDIEYGSFSSCTSLSYVIIPDTVSYIDSSAFSNCTSLEKIYFAGSNDEWDSVDTSIQEENVTFLSPRIYVEKTFTAGKMVLSFKASDNFNAVDLQLVPHGEVEFYRAQVNKTFTSANNRTTGIISMCTTDEVPEDTEILKVTYNVKNCENYFVDISFLDCTVLVEGNSVSVPVNYSGGNIIGGHTFDSWNITAKPSADSDGIAEGTCDCCGTVTKTLPFAFKNCYEEDNIIFIDKYGLNETDFRMEYLINDDAEVELQNRFAGTDSTVKIDYGDNIIYDYTVSLLGDVDGDGFCDAQDAVIIACIKESMLTGDDLSRSAMISSDCTGDGATNEDDVSFAFLHGIE